VGRQPRSHGLSARWAEDLPDVAQAYAARWALGVQRQHDRLKAGPDEYGDDGLILDAIQYTVCLRNLMRAAYLIHDTLHPHDPGYVEYWLKDFERRCPGIVAARDWLEHFDEYALGIGKAQRKRGRPRTPLRLKLDRSPEGDWTMTLVAAGRRIVIDLARATAAAADLWIALNIARDVADEERPEPP
jgi:hypothetical protein